MWAPQGGMTFRLATESDLPALRVLLAEVMRSHGVEPVSRGRMDTTLRFALHRPDHDFLLGEVNGRTVAMCSLITQLSTWRNALVCEIQDVVVTERSRRTGIGRELVEEAARIARRRGCAHLYLTAESWNLSAHAFYRSAGFTEKALLYFERDLPE